LAPNIIHHPATAFKPPKQHFRSTSQRNMPCVPQNQVTYNVQPIFSHWSLSRTAFFLSLLTIIAISPALLVKIPAMMDYPNNLARMYILVAARNGEANTFYQVNWGVYPNLAMDLIVPQLARFTSVETAGRVFLILTELLVVSGAVSLEFTTKRRMEIAGPTALIILYGAPFAFGLINFEFSLGLSLWAIASWIFLERRSWYLRFGVHVCFVCSLFFAEAIGLGVYGLAIGLYELSRLCTSQNRFKKAALTFSLMAAPAIAVFSIAAPALGRTIYWKPLLKAPSIFLSTNGYSFWLSCLLTSTLIVAIYVLWRSKMLSLSDAGRWIAAGFLICFIVLPFQIFNSAFVDFRFPAAALLVFPAFVKFSIPLRHLNWVRVTVAAVISINTAYVGWCWITYDKEYMDLKASFRLLKKDSRVLVGFGGNNELTPTHLSDAPMLHAPTLAVHYAKALVPTLFAFPGLQPVTLKPEFTHFRILQTQLNDPVPMQVLKAIATGAERNNLPEFVRHWPDYYDYLYLLGPHISNPVPGILQEIDESKSFTLYRIRNRENQSNRVDAPSRRRD
jgi:hypothetical protein